MLTGEVSFHIIKRLILAATQERSCNALLAAVENFNNAHIAHIWKSKASDGKWFLQEPEFI